MNDIDPVQAALAKGLREMVGGRDTNSESTVLHGLGRMLREVPQEKLHPDLVAAFGAAEDRFLPTMDYLGRKG